jgi:TolB-like protein/DNA-binding winged helix-turn-helix (wHTH) protein
MSADSDSEVFTFLGFSVDARQRLLFGPDGRSQPLSGRAFDTLLYLVEHPNQLIDKHTLMKAVWPTVVVEENNLNQNISIVRRALGETPGEHRFVVTIPGRGFRFVPSVTRASTATTLIQGAPPSTTPEAQTPSPSADTPSGPVAPTIGPARTPLMRWIAAAAAATALLWVAFLVVRHQAERTTPVTEVRVGPAPVGNKPRIAILPFENLSPDPANAFFADGLHEQIVATLSSRTPGLEVISRTTMMTYRSPKPIELIARELGATHVLEGSVRREGDTVRLTLQLIDARTDDHVWSQDYDRTLRSALTLQSEVADEVASQIPVQVSGGTETFKPLTQDPEAYDLYLKAQLEAVSTHQGLDTTLESLRRIQGLLDGAIAHDPKFAAAYAQRAGVKELRFLYNYNSEEEVLPSARNDLDEAEHLAPNDPTVLVFKGMYLAYIDRDLKSALATLHAAYAAGPTEPMVISLPWEALEMAGRLDEAIERVRQARTLDPKNQYVLYTLFELLLDANRPAEALRTIDFAIAELPDSGPFRIRRPEVVWDFTGSATALAEMVSASPPLEITATSDVDSLYVQLLLFRLQNRYTDLLSALDRAQTKVIRSYLCAGTHPVAELRGWVHLLLGDRVSAEHDAYELRDFVAHQNTTKWNRAFLQLLSAEAATFVHDNQRAVVEARDALNLAQWPVDRWRVEPMVATVYAWAGAADEAVRMFEEFPYLAPAEIARDPLYTVPLAGNARYQALKAKLEAQMAATRLE